MTFVVRHDNESFEGLFKRFRKNVQQERILKELRRRRFFEKPSVLRKKKRAAKRRKSLKQTLKFKYRHRYD